MGLSLRLFSESKGSEVEAEVSSSHHARSPDSDFLKCLVGFWSDLDLSSGGVAAFARLSEGESIQLTLSLLSENVYLVRRIS